jgi:hypothetical protein
MIESDDILISIHIPKTAGTTFYSILSQIYNDRIQLSYGGERDNKVENPLCYHGHLGILNFTRSINCSLNTKWVVFLRDPLKSAISLYNYGLKYGLINNIELTNYLIGTNNAKWPFPSAYRHNRLSKWISKTKGKWEEFTVVGITEYFDESISIISDELKWPRVNFISQNIGEYDPPKVDKSVQDEFKLLNSVDYRMYHDAVACLMSKLA